MLGSFSLERSVWQRLIQRAVSRRFGTFLMASSTASASPSWGRFLGQRIAGRQTERAHFATIAKPLGAAFARLIACAPALVAERSRLLARNGPRSGDSRCLLCGVKRKLLGSADTSVFDPQSGHREGQRQSREQYGTLAASCWPEPFPEMAQTPHDSS